MEPIPRFDAIVIGSGFGGSINALRLASAGRRTLVLERGQRYRPGEFPRDITNVERLFWRYPRHARFRGLYEVRFFSGLAAVVASGVGGGSLIYANIHIRPDPDVFDDPRWPASVNRGSLDRHYDSVAKMLAVAPVPATLHLKKRDAFVRAAQQLGRPIFDPDEAVKWAGPDEPTRASCRLCTQCEFGCQYGAKSTLDLTYLAQAERLGAEVCSDAYVTAIAPADGGYVVTYRNTSVNPARRTPESVFARRVVVCAGTLGTNELLLRCRDLTRTLPLLSARLGHGYSANGDFLGSVCGSANPLDPWHRPDVTSVIHFDNVRHSFTMAAPTFSRPVMDVLASMGQPNVRWLRWLSPVVWWFADRLLVAAFRHGFIRARPPSGQSRAADPARMTNLFAIGRDNANGRLHLRNGQLDVVWDYARENEVLIANMTRAMGEVSQAYEGTFAPLATWELFRRIITVHSLGGCHLSDSRHSGVVSPYGEVHRYPGLFVADGSVIPTSIGFHPAMTISAVSERIAEAVVASYP
jgi:cholesterol oxidase